MAERVLFVDHAPALGGAEGVLLTLLARLDRRRWAPHLACTGGPLATHAGALGLPVHVVPLVRLRRSPRAAWDWLTGVQALARCIHEAGAGLIVANTVRGALYAAPAAAWTGQSFAWHMHDFWLSEGPPRRPWADALGKRLLSARAAAVLAISRAVADHLPCQAKITVVYDGIEIERFDPGLDGLPFRHAWGIPPGAPLVGMVGRLRPWKGQERFLRTMARVAEAIPQAHLAVVGGAILEATDGYEQRLRDLAHNLGLAGRVAFTGHLEDVRPALAALDVFVHPGDPEPFGLVTVEAMAMGKPVVALAHGALPEIVVHGETGLLVPPGDEAALGQAVVDLLRDPGRRAALGSAGRARVGRCFTAERMAAEVDAVLERVLRRRTGGI